MTGIGTQESPYIIMDASDLYSMARTGGNQIYFSLGSDIDLNDSQYAENFVPIPLNCKMLIGNNHVIRNVNYSIPDQNVSMFTVSGDDEKDITIDGLRIENIRLSGKNSFIFSNSGSGKCNIFLNHCDFVMNDITFTVSEPCSSSDRRCIMHNNNVVISADYCTFVTKVYFQKVQPIFFGDTISHSQFKFEITTQLLNASSDINNAPMSGVKVSDSYFFMTINKRTGENTETIDFSSSDSTFSGCYMVCEVIAGISLVQWNGRIGNICFFDKDVLTNTVKNASLKGSGSYTSKILGLTTEQCKDAVYLRSIGFNCAGADE